ncbi:hypothetical protein FEE96_05960 [Parasedimentitalea maritima]|uniref:Recombinase domain-containing protein n=1 Tax=Parasedimentitalea maritima TaxID=2578117 RepID=A0ABY2V0R7_9RHOB|nr:recombinase family protein [Zongyanglinia marina]TLP68059.1 hypothetical protein FEE96_05960 [Zongyanglinia marina]
MAVEESEASVIRLMFDLALYGDGQTGPLGLKEIVKWLNERGYRTRKGTKWGINAVHRYFQKTTVAGEFIFNSSQDGGKAITIPVPPIIERSKFDLVRATMEARAPSQTPPRVVTGDVLLTGLAKCSNCGNEMTMGAGNGNGGRYHYYQCAAQMRQGKTACEGHRFPMKALDQLIVDQALADLFSAEKISALMEPMLSRQSQSKAEIAKRLADRETEVLDAEKSIDNLYDLVTTNLVHSSDPDFRQRCERAQENMPASRKSGTRLPLRSRRKPG